MALPILFFGMLGLIVGSFLNVVILRYGIRDLGGRSACPSCGRGLPWYDMVPAISYLALGGRCRSCGTRISVQYPLVELGTGLLFALVAPAADFAGWGLAILVLDLAILSVLVCITVYDLRHTIIPDPWVWTFNALAFLSIIFNFQFSIFNFLAGPVAALPLFALWLFSRGSWMGFGDVKLALGIGFLLGPGPGLFAVFFAFILGGIFSLPLLVLSSEAFRNFIVRFTPTPTFSKSVWGFTMKSEIPFGPFLIIACLLIWFAQMYNLELPFLAIYGLQ